MAFNNNKIILSRYAIIFILLLVFAITIIFSATKLIFSSEGKEWRKVGLENSIIKDKVVLPYRGNIYANNLKLLATSEPLYNIYMDFWADGIKKDSLYKYVDSLSYLLSKKFTSKSQKEYKSTILNNWKLREKEKSDISKGKKVPIKTRYVRIIKENLSYLDLKELYTYPFFNQKSNKNGLIAEEKSFRRKPFGNLASRTIGNLYQDLEKGGSSGLELKFDSILRGVNGIKNRRKIQGRWIDIIQTPAEPGYDIITTLDPDIQEIATKALRSRLIDQDAESGTVIIMDVKSGEIRGIANLDRITKGIYTEGNPNAFSYMNEPGSTFKTATVMAALDDGVVTPTDSFYVGKGVFNYKGHNINDWYHGRTDKGYLTVKDAIKISSNVVISKIALKGYENKPSKYVDALDRIGLRKKLTWDTPLNGIEGTSYIRYPNDKNNPWSKTTLPWMSFGYETKIPPIYMIMFYNAIANNGKMIKPFIAKSLIKDGKIEKSFEAKVIKDQICKKQTLLQIQDMLKEVVKDGTGKKVKSNLFEIAGKTGTAQLASRGKYNNGHYVSFCGYFPSNNPQYTCFVGIMRPRDYSSGNQLIVFKDLAEQIYLRNMKFQPIDCKIDSTTSKSPKIEKGKREDLEFLFSNLDIKYNNKSNESEWITVNNERNKYEIEPLDIKQGFVPDVVGMSLKDGLFILERQGLKVRISGIGKISSQSLKPNSQIVKGQTINITLK